MARCKDCIHFSICEKGFPFADGKGGGWCEDFLTADVVPKSKVEELSGRYEDLKLKYVDLAKDHDELLAWGGHIRSNEKAEIERAVAREIFEEIEKIRAKEIRRCEVMREKEVTNLQRMYWEGGEHSLRQLSYWIAELKKKYTESEG